VKNKWERGREAGREIFMVLEALEALQVERRYQCVSRPSMKRLRITAWKLSSKG
jgi:hypothetical protein